MKITLLLIILTLFTISACNNKDEDIPQNIYKVAMLAEGNTFDDLSFLQSCKEGMELAKNDFNLIVEYNIDTSHNYQERINSYGDQDFDLIFSIGFMWNDAVEAAAKNYPNSKFIIVGTELKETQNNALSIIFDVDEAAYPLGFLSAWWADSHNSIDAKIASVGALFISQIRQFIEPFNNGAVRYNQQYGKSVDTMSAYADEFFNEELGKHIADSLITLGADVIFGVGSETGNGSLIKAKEHGIPGIGVDVDQFYSFPEVSDIILSSAMKGLDNAIYDVAASFDGGIFTGGGIYNGKLANSGVGTAPYHNYEGLIPDSIKTEIEYIKTGIIDGSISTGW
jgi:basic membrane protein A